MPSLRNLALAVTASLICLVSSAFGGLAPENVAVVVNGDSWASLTVANEYARVRGIPACNFIVLTGLTSIEVTDVEHFRAEILTPVFATLAKRGLTAQIDCIAYSVDIPYAVDVTSDMAGKKLPKEITPVASTTGLTYLHDWVEKQDTDYLRLDINRYNRRVLSLKDKPLKVQAGAAFRSRYGWSENGEPGSSGPHYILSTMLGVTCGRGNSVNEVIDSIRRSAVADGTMPGGSIYFMQNGDVRSTTRAWAFQEAAKELNQMGVNAVVEDGILPITKRDIAGAMIGTSDFDWSDSKSRILPGAIVEHFTSFGGIISERGGQTPCTEFIRAGASGTSGTVTEPYALQQKFPTAFMQVQYCHGWTLAESYFQSVSGPYQLLVIGDPLCRPWSKRAAIKLAGFRENETVRGTLVLSPNLPPAEQPSIAAFELYVDGRYVASASKTPLILNTKNLADGEHRLSVVAAQKGAQQVRTHLMLRIRVDNRKQMVKALPHPPKPVAFGDSMGFLVSCPGALSIELLHMGRRVGSVQGSSGVISVPTKLLGLGVVTLQPVANMPSRSGIGQVFGVPIEYQVDPPRSMPSSSPASASLASGLALSVNGASPITVKDTFDASWLSNLVHEPSARFTLSGTFDVPNQDLYQLQLKTNTGAAVQIDGVRILSAKDGRQLLAPVALMPGTHRLQVIGTAPGHPTLDIRLGAAGAKHLAEAQFKHATQ